MACRSEVIFRQEEGERHEGEGKEEGEGGRSKAEGEGEGGRSEGKGGEGRSEAKGARSEVEGVGTMEGGERLEDCSLSIIVLGASGDLATKKTFPSLFSLFCLNLLPRFTRIWGFARSSLSLPAFQRHASQHLRGFPEKRDEFLSLLSYCQGRYDAPEDFKALDDVISQEERQAGQPANHRLFYFAIPPNVYASTSRAMQAAWRQRGPGWRRVVIEKPFGEDLESSRRLSEELGKVFQEGKERGKKGEKGEKEEEEEEERELYRIDHYLGKEMVQNLMVLRFANLVFEPLWNRNYVTHVVISFREQLGIEGRAGYFERFGIIRDVMQNHLMQLLALVAMETPASLDPAEIRREKARVLRCCTPLSLDDVIVGQYTGEPGKGKRGYLEEEGVAGSSITPTYSLGCLWINNPRWQGVPFLLECGKALDQAKTEIRLLFQKAPGLLFLSESGAHPPINELVIRVQPNEAIFLKFNQKRPGFAFSPSSSPSPPPSSSPSPPPSSSSSSSSSSSPPLIQTKLDLCCKSHPSFPSAYERLIYDVIRGDPSLFVGREELEAAWEIFTPLLHQLEEERIQPFHYSFGSRGPREAGEMARRVGVSWDLGEDDGCH